MKRRSYPPERIQLVVRVSPEVKAAAEQAAEMAGCSITKYLEKTIEVLPSGLDGEFKSKRFRRRRTDIDTSKLTAVLSALITIKAMAKLYDYSRRHRMPTRAVISGLLQGEVP